MLMVALYSISVGFVWGWTIGWLIGRDYSRLFEGLTIGTGLILFLIQIYFLAGWISSVLFLGGTILALIIHFQWLRSLRIRFGELT